MMLHAIGKTGVVALHESLHGVPQSCKGQGKLPSGWGAGFGGLGQGVPSHLSKPGKLLQAVMEHIETQPSSRRQELQDQQDRRQQQPQEQAGGIPPRPPTHFEDGDSGGGSSGPGWNPFAMLAAGLAQRMEADPSFLYKLCVECGLDAAIILSVNLATRKDKFLLQLEFVGCQLAVSLLNDFALVYLLAPVAAQSVVSRGHLQRMLASLPAHALQRAGPGQPAFTAAQRLACFAIKAVQYGSVGFAMGCMGTGLVHGLTAVRETADASYEPPPFVQPIVGTGLGWLYFMGLSSNMRYNTINALEDALYSSVPGSKAKMASVGLRLLNNVYASFAWLALAEKMNLNRPRTLWCDKERLAAAGPVVEPLQA